MKKILSIVIIGFLVLSGLGTATFTTNDSHKSTVIMKYESTSVLFSSQPTQLEKDDFIQIEMSGTTTKLLIPNKPVLPIYVNTYEIPFRSTNIQVTCHPQNIGTMTLTKEVIPACIAPLSKMNENIAYVKDASVYESASFYPGDWYTYELGAGRNQKNQQVTFVKVVCYPIQYSPLKNQIEYAGGFEISVNYDAPIIQATTFDTSYDMVVIAPAAFETTLQPLIDFKNGKGIATIFKSMEEILSEYTGFDPPEQVKYFIKYAYDTWSIKYVMLVGGLKSHINAKDKDTRSAGWKAWWVPVRYVTIPEDEDEGCLSDLYYGCLYNATANFDSWDSNGDGIYANWGWMGAKKDKFDMYPEVYVSRIPVVNTKELDRMVQKIIIYENSGPAAKPWYKTFVGVGGKTFDYYKGKPDGEYLCDLAAGYMTNVIPDLNLVKVYSTNRDAGGLVPDKKGISVGISQGAGFVDFEGHGNPFSWNTIWFDGEYENHDWVGGINLYDFWRISNGEKQPIVIVGGCHNGMYNTSVIPTILDRHGASYFSYGVPIPVCFSWGLIIKPRGGAIASTGCTGYGMGYSDNPVTLSAELESNFFWQIGMNGSTNLAQAHSMAIQKFLAEESVDQTEAFCITNWALFGDPSLRFGGYSS